MIYTIGDRILNIATDSGVNQGKKGVVSMVDTFGQVHIKYDDGEMGQSGDPELYYKIINKNIMEKLSIGLKKVLDTDTKKLVEAGILDRELDLTIEGRRILDQIVLAGVKSELVAEADIIINEKK